MNEAFQNARELVARKMQQATEEFHRLASRLAMRDSSITSDEIVATCSDAGMSIESLENEVLEIEQEQRNRELAELRPQRLKDVKSLETAIGEEYEQLNRVRLATVAKVDQLNADLRAAKRLLTESDNAIAALRAGVERTEEIEGLHEQRRVLQDELYFARGGDDSHAIYKKIQQVDAEIAAHTDRLAGLAE